jgi:predicted branched-subunit amino acid permease
LPTKARAASTAACCSAPRAQWPAWVTGTILGVIVAPSTRLLHATGLDVVFPAFFALLLLGELRHARSARIAAAGGAVITALLLLALSAGPALLGGAAAALLGLRRTGTPRSC